MSEDVLDVTPPALGRGAAGSPPEAAKRARASHPAAHDHHSHARRIFLWLLFLACGAVILSSWLGGSPPVKRAALMPAGAGLGLRMINLPSGATLEAPRRGFIDSLVTALKSDDPADDEGPFIFDRLEFSAGSSNLTPSSVPQLEQLAAVLKAFPQIAITVEGHTDNVGDAAANKKLSAQRAQAVKGELAAMGVSSARIATVGYGASRPIAGNGSEDGRARNRRVQVAIAKR